MTLQKHIEEIRNGLETDRFPNQAAVSQSIILIMVQETEKLCGHKPTEDLVLDFLKRLKITASPGDTDETTEEDEPKKQPPYTRLVVTLGDGELISYRNASNTFVEVIEKLGIERVRDLRIIENRIPLISTTKSDKRRQNKSGPYYIMTQTLTKRKKSLLKEIADRLSVSLTIEIVKKNKPTEDLVLDFLKRLKVTASPEDTDETTEEDETKKRHPYTRLVVTLGDGELISYRNASDTFVKVIEKLGIERVRNLRIIEKRIPLISTTKSDRYNPHKSGSYYIVTHTTTKRKKSLLEEIADRLGVSLTIEIVEKNKQVNL